jgi:hypothetical protein
MYPKIGPEKFGWGRLNFSGPIFGYMWFLLATGVFGLRVFGLLFAKCWAVACRCLPVISTGSFSGITVGDCIDKKGMIVPATMHLHSALVPACIYSYPGLLANRTPACRPGNVHRRRGQFYDRPSGQRPATR